MSRRLDAAYDPMYQTSSAAPASTVDKLVTKRVANYDNFFSDVKTHPNTELVRKPPLNKLGAQDGAEGGSARGRGVGKASSGSGALAAERARLAAKARSAATPLAVCGLNASSLAHCAAGTTPSQRTVAAPLPTVRALPKGRATAAVTARLAHIDALLAKSKAAAHGARGYGDCWPASLGKAPPPAATQAQTQAPASSMAAEYDEDEEDDAAPVFAVEDWEVTEAMKAAEWAVSEWESGADLTTAQTAQAQPGGPPAVSAPQSQASEMDMEEVALRLQAAARGRQARVIVARLRLESQALVQLSGLAAELVDSALVGAVATISLQDSGLAPQDDDELLVHTLVEEAMQEVLARLQEDTE